MIPLIVGDRMDPHTQAVIEALSSLGSEFAVVDASSLTAARWRWQKGSFQMYRDDGWQSFKSGWLRRLAPPGLAETLVIGERAAVEYGSRLSLLAALSDTHIWWLTDYWTVLRGENKLVQYRCAERTGIKVPQTTVISHASDIPDSLGESFVVKPLGAGQFTELGVHYAVHSKLISRDAPELAHLGGAPFLLQQRITAESHLRVVTVLNRSWTARLEAEGLPLDWRESESAHSAWKPARVVNVEAQGTALAAALGLGFSSQDWIVDTAGMCWFIDANPSGQWLFLPEPISSSVGTAIAEALDRPDS